MPRGTLSWPLGKAAVSSGSLYPSPALRRAVPGALASTDLTGPGSCGKPFANSVYRDVIPLVHRAGYLENQQNW